MKSTIKLKGQSKIDFNSPKISLTISEIANSHEQSSSGLVRFLLLNGRFSKEGKFSHTKLIGKCYLQPLWSKSTRSNVVRMIKMKADITQPYLILKVEEKREEWPKWVYADSAHFTFSEQQIKQLGNLAPKDKPKDEKSESQVQEGLTFEDIKTGMKIGLRITGVALTIGSFFNPALSIPNKVVNALGGLF